MKPIKTIEDALEFAIQQEEIDIAFYMDLMDKTSDNPYVSLLFEKLVLSKQEHLMKLQAVRVNKSYQYFSIDEESYQLIPIDYIASIDYSNQKVSRKRALDSAIKKEKATYKFYMELNKQATNQTLKNVFKKLAQIEAKHMQDFELKYNEYHK